jgi:hypothetical protein
MRNTSAINTDDEVEDNVDNTDNVDDVDNDDDVELETDLTFLTRLPLITDHCNTATCSRINKNNENYSLYQDSSEQKEEKNEINAHEDVCTTPQMSMHNPAPEIKQLCNLDTDYGLGPGAQILKTYLFWIKKQGGTNETEQNHRYLCPYGDQAPSLPVFGPGTSQTLDVGCI